jgi:anti-repressor protein
MSNIVTGATMTSLEIAEIAGKQHKDLLRSIRNMEPAWEGASGRKFALAKYIDKQGKPREQYELTKREVLYVTSKFSDEIRALLILRLEELELQDQKAVPNFNNPAEAARAWADQYEVAQQASQKAFIEEQARVKAEKIVEEQAPKVAFTNAVSASSGSCLIGELAKLLAQNGYKIGEKRLFAWMRENGYLGSQGERHNVPNQRYIEQKLFEIKRGVRTGSGGEMKTTLTPKVTGKGQVYFIEKLITSKQMVLKEACNLPTN